MKNNVRLHISHEKKMSDFVSFPFFGFTIVIKLRSFNFESHQNTSMFFDQKKDLTFDYVLPHSVVRGAS